MYFVIKYITSLQLITIVVSGCNIYVKNDVKWVECWRQGLTSVPQNLPPDIDILNLSWNNLSTINSGEIERYRMLKQLLIRDNNLVHLDSAAFSGLDQLEILKLSGNALRVSDYPITIFKHTSKLTYLDIKQNRGNDDKTNEHYSLAFTELTNLNELHIDLLYNANFSASFQGMVMLTVLRFDFCYVHALNNDTFINLPKTIKELYMENCQNFLTIEPDTLKHFPILSVLDFSGSYMHLIQALNALYPMQNKSMKSIDFHHVTDRSITEYEFDTVLTSDMMKYISAICLSDLDISDNNIVAIRNKSLIMFQHPECFQNLILSANRFHIVQFEDEFLGYLWKMTNLLMLDYSYFPLEFKNPTYEYNRYGGLNRQSISSSQNSEPRDNKKTIRLPGKLQHLRLTNIMANLDVEEVIIVSNGLTTFDVSYFECNIFPNIVFKGIILLLQLDLSGIRALLTKGKFQTLSNLPTLKMKETNLYELIKTDDNIFNWTPGLNTLDISHNFIWYLSENSLGNLWQLQELNLSNNMLQIAPTSLIKFKNIQKLDLSYNHITSLEKPIRDWLDKDSFKLFLNGNSFVCTCDTIDFLLWIYTTKSELDNDRNYTCRLKDGTLDYTTNVHKNFHYHFADCDSKTWLQYSVSLLTSMSIVIVLVTIVYNFRWRLIFFFHRRFRRGAELKLKLNFVYDVYVSYADDGALFVKNILQPKIEKQWGLTMCCEDRDFVAGESAVDARVMSIHHSRHIIFVVTTSFIHREWSSFEIERAKYEQCLNNLQKIVVITKNVSFRHIPSEFATIWRDVYIIEWPHGNEELQTAWQKLRLWFL